MPNTTPLLHRLARWQPGYTQRAASGPEDPGSQNQDQAEVEPTEPWDR